MNQIQRSMCPYDCPASCGLLVETHGTRVVSVKGDPENEATRGLICNKMQHYEDSVYAPGRILVPLKRTGKKGEGKFAPVSWDDAVEEITGRWKEIIREYGGEALLPVYFSAQVQRCLVQPDECKPAGKDLVLHGQRGSL